jgi:hypothetical protein
MNRIHENLHKFHALTTTVDNIESLSRNAISNVMNSQVKPVFGDNTGDAVACLSHPIAKVDYVLEVNKEAVDKR